MAGPDGAEVRRRPVLPVWTFWAKLLWAGLNLQAGNLPVTTSGQFYPLELVRAVTVTWLFTGQRRNEIARLRVGCIRWQHDGAAIDGDSGEVLARDAVHLLDVPTTKTGTAFTKPLCHRYGFRVRSRSRWVVSISRIAAFDSPPTRL
ncbi:hypothetical protein ACTD5D_09400 [Nocardia takedensis]|uniref:hypothetical protein n=1 Tax=Nocardia takedensis TaxID=259390 RepID=UPI003F769357